MQGIDSAELFRSIVRSSTDGFWIFDEQGVTTYASDRLAQMLGRDPGDMVGLAVAELLDDAGKRELSEHLERLARTDTGRDNLECNFIRADGTRIWGLVSHSPLLDDDGLSRGWLHRVTEFTDRKRLLDEIDQSQQKMAEAQALAKIGSWEWDILEDVVTWSDELYRIHELDPLDLKATYDGFLACIHPEDRERVEQTVSSAFTATEPFEFEARVIKSSGTEGWVRGRGQVTRDGSGTPIRLGGTTQEITDSVVFAQELAAARDAATRASRMKSEFLATMSHEIRTPLNGVIGLAGLMLNTELDHLQLPLAEGIAQAGTTLLGLINDILDLSKIEAGKLELEAMDFQPGVVVEQVTALMGEAARARSVDLVVDCAPDVPLTVRGDSVRFGQVVTNLVSNAVKFTKDGQVRVQLMRDATATGSERLRVEVSDTGIGIPQSAHADVFESFTQADASTTREYGGTGLGLAISRRLVEALGGQIDFTSELGMGSTFWFTAEFSSVAAPAPEQVLALARPVSLSRTDPLPKSSLGVVLVAEDNLVNQMVARGVLEGLGYAVQFAADGVEAVAAVASTPKRFVAVLMDCQMPRLDGYEATQAIRRLEREGDRVVIIAMTASAVVGERQRCLAAGMDDFLLKPIDFELLESTLASWISSGAAQSTISEQPPVEGLLDLARIRMLDDLRPGDKSFFRQFANTFMDRVSIDVDAIEAAVRAQDSAALAMAAHTLKGSAQNLGAAQIGRVSQAVEDAARVGDVRAAYDLVPDLHVQVGRTVEKLRALVAEAG